MIFIMVNGLSLKNIFELINYYDIDYDRWIVIEKILFLKIFLN